MQENVTRRHALVIAAASTSAFALTPLTARSQGCASADDRVGDVPGAQTWAEEHQKLISLGFTQDEADCWEFINRAAGKFFELPELHPSDGLEVAEAVHVIQNKLLSRPTYRRYIEPNP